MKKTPEEMADHVREAINNANEVLKEANEIGMKVELTLHNSVVANTSLSVKSIHVNY